MGTLQMLTKEKMQEIQDLKLRGLSKTEIIKFHQRRVSIALSD